MSVSAYTICFSSLMFLNVLTALDYAALTLLNALVKLWYCWLACGLHWYALQGKYGILAYMVYKIVPLHAKRRNLKFYEANFSKWSLVYRNVLKSANGHTHGAHLIFIDGPCIAANPLPHLKASIPLEAPSCSSPMLTNIILH